MGLAEDTIRELVREQAQCGSQSEGSLPAATLARAERATHESFASAGRLRASLLALQRQARAKPVSRRVESAVQFVAGGLFGVQMWWIEGRARDMDEMDGLFRRLAVPAVRAVLG